MNGIAKLIVALVLVAAIASGIYFYRAPIAAWLAPGDAGAAAPSQDHSQHDMAAMSAEKKPGERKILYWVDPMHPAYKSDKPGTAPDCGMDLVPVYADQGEGEGEPSLPPGAVKITAQKLQLIGVEYGEVSDQPLAKTIRAVGRVAYDETKIARIHPKIEGWIEQVFVDFTGKQVEKGQPLISLYSPELLATQQEFLLAKRAKETLGNSAYTEVSSGAVSLYQAARDRMRLWDISDAQIQEIEQRGTPQKTLTLYAPLSGFVLARNAYEKQRVGPDTELYALADLSTVWVLADVYEYELPMVQLGQTAQMSLAYFPNRTFTGKVCYIYPQLDNATRTLKVRLEFPNPDFQLKPDMFANVEIRIDYGRVLSVPEEAVLDSGAEQIVFVAHEAGYFEPRHVRLGGRVDGRVIVLEGLKRGERIVTSGNFLIDSESRLKSALGGMTGHTGHGGAPASGEKTPAPPKKQEIEHDHSQHQQAPSKEPPKKQAPAGQHQH